MRQLLVFSSALVLAGSAAAQGVNESFDTSTSGVFPPAGWAVTVLPGQVAPDTWVDTSLTSFSGMTAGSVSLADAAGHDYTTLGMSDNRLESPAMDLSSFGNPQLTYDGSLGYYNWMSHTSTYFGESHIEVSTDGGATWSTVWQEAAMNNYNSTALVEDLTATAANQASVMVGFRYAGDFAHEWGIDNVIVDNVGPAGPALAISGSCPGAVSLDASNMTAGGPVVFAYSLGTGSITLPGGPCAGLTIAMAAPVRLGTVIADAAGSASFAGNAPANACGNVVVAAADLATCSVTNVAAL